ncbi:hypothetical protein OAE25_03275 [Verrucomicrobiales bacterium]|nr:hypothetical protein [Verrucomicrobiales bacterium]
MNKNEELIREFIDFLGWERRPKLQITEITNHSSNDYLRDLTAEETEKLISDFLENVEVLSHLPEGEVSTVG